MSSENYIPKLATLQTCRRIKIYDQGQGKPVARISCPQTYRLKLIDVF